MCIIKIIISTLKHLNSQPCHVISIPPTHKIHLLHCTRNFHNRKYTPKSKCQPLLLKSAFENDQVDIARSFISKYILFIQPSQHISILHLLLHEKQKQCCIVCVFMSVLSMACKTYLHFISR